MKYKYYSDEGRNECVNIIIIYIINNRGKKDFWESKCNSLVEYYDYGADLGYPNIDSSLAQLQSSYNYQDEGQKRQQ
jgi:hypothetical protein